MGQSKSSSKREDYIDTTLLQKIRKTQINNLTLYLKKLEKEQTKPKASRRKELIKIRVVIMNRD